MIYNLKTWPSYFQEIIEGTKTFEVRRQDRNFHSGDILILEEYDPLSDTYTGRNIKKEVGFMISGEFGVKNGYCVMSLLGGEK